MNKSSPLYWAVVFLLSAAAAWIVVWALNGFEVDGLTWSIALAAGVGALIGRYIGLRRRGSKNTE